jgi:hypothetical protein
MRLYFWNLLLFFINYNLSNFKFSINENVGHMPIASSSKIHYFLSWHSRDYIIVKLYPSIPSVMRPSNVMSSFCASAFVCNDCYQLVTSSFNPFPKGLVEIFIMLFHVFYGLWLLKLLVKLSRILRNNLAWLF